MLDFSLYWVYIVFGCSTYAQKQHEIHGGFVMGRIYSNYSDTELALVQKEADEMGMSLSAYQKYRTLLSLSTNNGFGMPDLITKMKTELSQKTVGEVFIVSTLLKEEWVVLKKNEKNTLSQVLKKIVKSNPDRYTINTVLPGKINQYIVLGDSCRGETSENN